MEIYCRHIIKAAPGRLMGDALLATCAGCGFENSDSSRFCGVCGAPVSVFKKPGFLAGGRYVIGDILEGGPGGWVYLGTDRDGGRPVRVRQLLPPPGAALASPGAIESGCRGINSLYTGAVAALLDIFFQGESLFAVFSRVEGESLDKFLARHRDGPDFVGQAVKLFVQALELLEHLRQGGKTVICGNIRPGSLVVTGEGGLFLLDPGFLWALEKPGDLAFYSRPGFTAPEVFTTGTITPAADVFSVGAVFYHCLTGYDPEKGKDGPFIFTPLKDANPLVPRLLAAIIDGMIQENPEDRPADMASLAGRVAHLKGDSPSDTHLSRGIAAYNRGDFLQAERELSRACLLDPGYSVAFFWRGMTGVAMGKQSEAERHFDTAIFLDPHYQAPLYQRGMLRLKDDRPEEAAADFSEAVRMDPRDTRSLLGRALAYKNTGSPAPALKDLDRALKIDPSFQEAYIWRGFLNYETGRVNQAISDYGAALSMDPDDAFCYLGRGLALAEKMEMKAALADLDRAVEINPAYGSAFLERGVLLAEMGMLETALLDLDRSLELDGGNHEAFYHRGWVRFRTGNYRGAIDDLTRFLEKEPGEAEATRLRAQAYRCIGDFRSAEKLS